MVVSRRRTRGRERASGLALGRREQYSKPRPKTKPRMRRDEGNGGSEGVVLDLQLVGDGINSAVYTVPVTVGSTSQPFHLQVDTGSSDLWIASKSCSSRPCTANKPRLYDPLSSSSSIPTNLDFHIDYLSGSVDGPIVWDSFTIGGYTIDNQALAAASNVVNESLSDSFSGILGLALPLNSVIAKTIPPGTNSVPDGATVMSNLFGTQPVDQAPAEFFYSVLLERPNINRIPSVLGIGRHPSSNLLSDGLTIEPERVEYANVVPENNGVLFWKAELRGITVYINGTAKEITLGPSVTGSVFPEAVLDTGVPYIISTPQIANAVWGAYGISPAGDGNYYVPCTTPINMTITLDDRSEIPIHPLDLSAVPGSGSICTGLFQASPALTLPHGFGDIILGVPFLRNVYTVMSYKPVDGNGVIGNGSGTPISPRLGLLNLTDPAQAMDEFNRVRVLNEPLGGTKNRNASSGGGISVGLKVLFGLLGFIAVCAALFAGRWFFMRRRAKQAQQTGRDLGDPLNDKDAYALAKYHLAPFRSHSFVPSEDTQRTLADPTARLDAKYDTMKGPTDQRGSFADEELGFRRSKRSGDGTDGGGDSGGDGDPDSDGDGDIAATTVTARPGAGRRPKIGEEGWDSHNSWIDSYSEYQPPLLGEWRPSDNTHERTYSSSSITSVHAPTVASPLLEGRRSTAMPLETVVDEFGGLDVIGMAGVGSGRRRASVVDEAGDADATLTNEPRRHSREHSRQQSHSPSFSQSHSRMSTASIGSLSGDSRYPTIYPPARPRPRVGRAPSGPRTSSMMSRVINADDIT